MQKDIKTINTDHNDIIHDISFDWHGNRLATCSSDKCVKIWNRNDDGEWFLFSNIKC